MRDLFNTIWITEAFAIEVQLLRDLFNTIWITEAIAIEVGLVVDGIAVPSSPGRPVLQEACER